MAQAAERVLGRRITAGLINVKDGHVAKLRRIELNECGHPVPDERGVDGARRIAQIAAAAGARRSRAVPDLRRRIGAAAAARRRRITLEEKQAITRLLLACGANIHEINAVRKHISRIKGGQLARLAAPARVESLLLSDVIGDDLDVIGSGPTAPDASTFAGGRAILDKYEHPRPACPPRCATASNAACAAKSRRRPSPAIRSSRRVRNTVIGSNRLALDAAAAPRPRTRLPHADALQLRSKAKRARSPACTPPSPAKSCAAGARCAAGLHHHRRRDHGHASRATDWAAAIRSSSWPPPSISPG